MSLEIVIEHTGSSTLAGRSQTFNQSRVRLGRRPDNDIAFDPHKDRLVSGYHAELETRGGAVQVKDLGSNNGLMVNGTKVSGTCPLQSGDEVQLGPDGPRMRITLNTGGAASAPAGAPAKAGVGKATLQRAINDATTAERQKTRGLVGIIVVLVALGGVGIVASQMTTSSRLKEEVETAKKDADKAKQDADKAKQDAARAGQAASKADETARKAEAAAKEAERKAGEVLAKSEKATREVLNRYDRELAALKGKIGKGESRIARLIVEIQERDRALKEIQRRQDLSQEERRKLLRETRSKLDGLKKKLVESEKAVRTGGGGGGGADWATLVQRYQHGLFLCFSQDRKKRVSAIGTAFCVRSDGLLATNAHVVKGMLAMPEAVVIQNDTGKIFKIKRMKYHPSFTTPQSPDVALIEIETGGAKLPALPLADTTKLQNLRIGTHLGTMGYPGELQAAYLSSIDPRTRTVKSALATFKDGWIGRMTNYRLERDDFDKRTFLQHSASLSGGTSGSPMFTADGTVVALNNAGLDLYVVVKKGKETGVKRAANAAEIGYAIRVDELRKFMQSTGW